MRLELDTAPAVTLISVDDLKTHLRIEHTAEDTQLATIVASVSAALDGPAGYLQRALTTQTWRAILREWPGGDKIAIRLPPLQSVTSITYYDFANASQTLATANYSVQIPHGGAGWIEIDPLSSWPGVYDRPDAITIEFVAGYGNNATDVPQPVRHAALLMAGALYKGRGDDEGPALMSPTVRALLSPYMWDIL